MLLCPAWVILLSGCLKKTDAVLNPGKALAISGKDLVQTLAAESSLKLFNQALVKLTLDKNLTGNQGFTVFALTDSAMTAAGLDAAGINKLPVDSLRKLIAYQIVTNSLDNNALVNNVVATQVNSLKLDTFTNVNGATQTTPTSLFVKLQGSFYFNGVPVSQSRAAIQATNGFIYPVSGFITPIPSHNLLDIIDADPDLSMYRLAISINGDDVMFAAKPSVRYPGMLPTVLAPTNKAFNDAGFHNEQDLIDLANRYYSGFDPNGALVYYYSSIDSVLKHHMIYNADLASTNNGTIRVLYNDFLTQAVNNNVFNTYYGGNYLPVLQLKFAAPLTFTAVGGTTRIKWTNDPSEPVVTLPHDASPQHPVNNFIASNGALYKIDKLFYPVAK